MTMTYKPQGTDCPQCGGFLIRWVNLDESYSRWTCLGKCGASAEQHGHVAVAFDDYPQTQEAMQECMSQAAPNNTPAGLMRVAPFPSSARLGGWGA